MRRVIMALFALATVAGGLSAQEKMTAEQRRQAEERLRQLRQEMRDLERKLGRESVVLVGPRAADVPLMLSINSDRPRLGVVVKTALDDATDSIGAVLQAVTPDGPAGKAGLVAGDIVVSFNGEKLGVTGTADVSPGDRLIELARGLEEGDSVRVQYRHGRETKTVVVVPRQLDSFSYSWGAGGDLDETRVRLEAVRRAQDEARRALRVYSEPLVRLGEVGPTLSFAFGGRWSDMELTTLDDDLGAYFGTTEGLLVVRAPKDSLLGIKSGDVILRIGGRVPTSASHAVRILRSYEPGDEIRIEVMRKQRTVELKATVPERDRGLFWEDQL